jgi:hypothetical protein
VQVGASAAAAVTSALAASFFGVAGTLIGAAVGSVVSTIAGGLYAHYLGRAGERIKETKEVVIQRIPGEVLSVTPLRHLTRPTDLPGRTSLQPIGDERGNESITAPVEEAGQLRQRPNGLAPLHQNANGAGGPTLNGTGGGGPASPPVRSPWKRPAMAMGAVSMAGFLISIGVVLATETALGHPVSGGESGNSLSGTISKVVDSDTKSDEVTPSETSTPSEAPSEKSTEAPTPSDTATTAPAPSETTDPGAGSDPSPTGEPTTESGDGSGDGGLGDTGEGPASVAPEAPQP